MDFRNNIALKEDYTFLVADAEGAVAGGEKGLYNRDTRFLSRYAWRFEDGFQVLLTDTPRPDLLTSVHGLIEGHAQQLGVRRELRLTASGLDDRVTLVNSGAAPRQVGLRLELDADFVDLFEVRGWVDRPRPAAARHHGDADVSFRYRASDGVEQRVEVRFSRPFAAFRDGAACFDLDLAPGETWQLQVTVALHDPLVSLHAGPGYQDWRASFGDLTRRCSRPALRRAIDDLRGLLLFTDAGPIAAAGIPWFAAAFGRDALIAAHLLLPQRPDVAAGTLRYLAGLQATDTDPFRAAEPGKIPHEVRFGELARTGAVPHARYYGTVDATALFVMLLGATARATGSDDLVRELRRAWQAALGWMTGPGDADGDGFVEFAPGASDVRAGLKVQSWKDSAESMAHADGSLASGPLAVCEVQGYAYAAFRAAAGFERRAGELAAADRWERRAARLKERFHAAFWLEPLGTYAMALDGEKRPLAVKSSDAGQLLWTGIVPEAAAPRLVATLFEQDSFSGWGFRTLAAGERRYNPVSYHNGSVWPHDTALIAAGLQRYGFHDEARRVARAVLDLAESQPDERLPELIAGYPRDDGPPVPYPTACRPQAWDAAAAVFLARILV